MSVYHFGQNPILSIEPPEFELPNDKLWGCTSAQEWLEASRKVECNFELVTKLNSYDTDKATANCTIDSAVNALFIDKELKNNSSALGSLIILHGVYQEVLRVKCYHTRPLSSWVPSFQWSQSPPESHDHSTSNSQNAATISNWRNAALDAVDRIHWSANELIAKAAGVEPFLVGHLHFARVVLLAPYQSIETLAHSLARFQPDTVPELQAISREKAAAAEEDIVRWAQQDEVRSCQQRFDARQQSDVNQKQPA
jgi:hypothetical protein